MPSFHVRFKGMLTGQERERLTAAGIELVDSQPSMVLGTPETGMARTGRPIYTVSVAAASADEALRKVREAIEPDTANFSGWEAEAIDFSDPPDFRS
jgi:hypothetical protein